MLARHVQEHDRWAKQLPAEPDALWDAIRSRVLPELFGLLAHCAALTVDTVQRSKGVDAGRVEHGQRLFETLGLGSF